VLATVGLSLGAALVLAVGFVVQQRVAAQDAGLAVAIVGVYLVAASPIVSGHLSHFKHRLQLHHDFHDGELKVEAVEPSSPRG
jgi:drug/metabolite transporter (DMT)-like permease